MRYRNLAVVIAVYIATILVCANVTASDASRYGSSVDDTVLQAIPTGKADRHLYSEFDYTEIPHGSATYVYGTIKDTVTWRKDKSPYILAESVFVTYNGKLIIDPGVVVKVVHPVEPDDAWTPGYRISCSGTLYAVGTPETPIRFTSAAASPVPNREWCGITIGSEKDASVLKWAVIEYADCGVDSVGRTFVAHCVVRNCNTAVGFDEEAVGSAIHNVIAGNNTGMQCARVGKSISLVNNILYKNRTGILLSESKSVYADYNSFCPLLTGTSNDGCYENLQPGAHDLKGDPGFTDAAKGDYKLLAGSPVKGKGYKGVDMGLYIESWSKESCKRETDSYIAHIKSIADAAEDRDE